MGPKALLYAGCFLVIGLYWMAHHRMFQSFRRFDRTLVWLNMLNLLCVAFLPVPSAVLGRYPGEPAAVRFYCVAVAAAALSLLLMWRYAVNGQRAVEASLPVWEDRINTTRPLGTAAAALLTAVVARWSATGAEWLLFGYIALSFPIGYLARRRVRAAGRSASSRQRRVPASPRCPRRRWRFAEAALPSGVGPRGRDDREGAAAGRRVVSAFRSGVGGRAAAGAGAAAPARRLRRQRGAPLGAHPAARQRGPGHGGALGLPLRLRLQHPPRPQRVRELRLRVPRLRPHHPRRPRASSARACSSTR